MNHQRHCLALELLVVSFLNLLFFHGFFHFTLSFRVRQIGEGSVWDHLPEKVQRRLIEKQARFFVIDAHTVARECGMGGRINTIMQTRFFAISGVLPQEEAIAAIKGSIRKTYSKKGDEMWR